MGFSRTQVDRLGERLRRGNVSDDDLRLLDAYRLSFAGPYAQVVAVLRDQLGLAPTGRRGKSTKSIIDKLNRRTARLSQVQDIAGCRVVVADLIGQDRVVNAIRERFGEVTVVDRRERPSNGYRAVHVLVEVNGRRVEIQIRTALQHLWAELSEKMSDRLGIEIKYGGGDDLARVQLDVESDVIAVLEHDHKRLSQFTPTSGTTASDSESSEQAKQQLARRQLTLEAMRASLQELIARFTHPSV